MLRSFAYKDIGGEVLGITIEAFSCLDRNIKREIMERARLDPPSQFIRTGSAIMIDQLNRIRDTFADTIQIESMAPLVWNWFAIKIRKCIRR